MRAEQMTLAYEKSDSLPPLRQGEILSGLNEYWVEDIVDDSASVEIRQHEYAIVMTQDCDLDQDFRARRSESNEPQRVLKSVLLCEIETAEKLRGSHKINSKDWSLVHSNRDERFHFLETVSSEHDLESTGLPELGVSFRRYFTVSLKMVYAELSRGLVRRRCRLRSPYLEHLSSRFSYYHSRIALPEPHRSTPVVPPPQG